MSDLTSYRADPEAADEAYLDSLMDKHKDAAAQLIPPVDALDTADPTESNTKWI